MISTLTQNPNGRVFVCGDIHGSYSRVMQFLEFIDFNKEVDHFICAGDLIDRGPDNEKCLTLLYEPWFHCCMGNHEHMGYEFYTGGPYGQYWSGNGGRWGARHLKNWKIGERLYSNHLYEDGSDSDVGDFIESTFKEKVKELPYLITVKLVNNAKFHVLHAELPPHQRITDEDLADPEKFTRLATLQSADGDYITWGRWAFHSVCKKDLDERTIAKARKRIMLETRSFSHLNNQQLSPIYSGHTIVRAPITIYKQTNLDTCAYISYHEEAPDWAGLSVTEPETGKFWLVNKTGVHVSRPVILA